MKKSIIILFLFVFSNVFSQNNKLDSARIYYNRAVYSNDNKLYNDALKYSLKSSKVYSKHADIAPHNASFPYCPSRMDSPLPFADTDYAPGMLESW